MPELNETIEADSITGILLPDGWHSVKKLLPSKARIVNTEEDKEPVASSTFDGFWYLGIDGTTVFVKEAALLAVRYGGRQ